MRYGNGDYDDDDISIISVSNKKLLQHEVFKCYKFKETGAKKRWDEVVKVDSWTLLNVDVEK